MDEATHSNKPKPEISIVGGGTAGLNTGIEALKNGYKNVRIFESEPHDPTLGLNPAQNTVFKKASEAGAQFYPFLGEDPKNDPVEQARWLEDALDLYLQREMIADYRRTMTRRKNTELMKKGDAQPMPAHLKRLLESFGPVREFGEVPRNPLEFVYGYDFTTLAIDAPEMLAALRREFKELGGNMVTRRITSAEDFFSLPGDLIVNCMGLGAQEIFPNLGLGGVKGQLLFYENPGISQIISAEDLIMMPRNDKVLYIGAGYWHGFETAEPTQPETDDLRTRVSQMISVDLEEFEGLDQRLSKARFIGASAGLRPVRKEGVLIAAEVGPQDKTVIHNVGHDGMGWTLAGTGKAAVRLIKEVA